MARIQPTKRPHPGDPNEVTLEVAGKIHRYRNDILLFIADMWGLTPQPVKPEYKEQWEVILRSTGDTWLRLKETVTAEWFGDCETLDNHTHLWKWYDFQKGKHITWQQVLILLAFEKAIADKRLSRHIAVKSGHGIGKSAVVSWVVLWFLYCFYMAQVPVTAPTAGQMHDVLWKELSIWISRMPEAVAEIYEWQHDYVRILYDPEAWYARAKTSTKENTEALAGVHADHVLLAADEASGIPEQVFNAAEGALTSGNTFVIIISNPTRTIGYFYDAHNKHKDDWQTFSFNCEESPVVDRLYVDKQAKRHGVTSNEYKIRVLGSFPSEDLMDDSGYLSLIPLSRIMVVPSLGEDLDYIGRKVLAVDPSGAGDDECEFVLKSSFKAKNILTLHTTNAKEIAMYIIKFADIFGLKTGDIVVEGFGNGADAAKQVAIETKGRLDCYLVLPGNSPVDEEKTNGEFFMRMEDELDPNNDDLFLNLRALGHFRMRAWLLKGGMLVDNNTETSEFAHQIVYNKYKRTLHGNKIQMMPKQEQQKLRIPSPNKSDALYLSFLLDRDETNQTSEEREAILHTEQTIDDPHSVI